MKLLRTIRLDTSDTFVFKKAAEPGEWAVSGAFVFAGADGDALQSKSRTAFRSGFLGIGSLGWSTLVQIVEASESDRATAVETLARRLVEHFGAPGLQAAYPAAEEEIAFAASLCSHATGVVIAVSRSFAGGSVRETFRALKPREGHRVPHAYAFLEVTGEDDTQVEEVDLATLANGGRK
jgi:hypothetical protein